MEQKRNSNYKKNFAVRYSFYGLAIGFLFPIIAILVHFNLHDLVFSFKEVYNQLVSEPLLIIIFFAPPVLMSAGFVIGTFAQKIYRNANAEAAQRYQRMIEYAGDIFYTSDAFGNFRYINSRVQKELGYTPEEIIGKHFTEIIAPEWKERVVAFYMKQFKDKTPESILEFRVTCKNGQPCWVEQTVTLNLVNENIIGYNGIVRKIEDRKRQEEIIKVLNKNLESKIAEAEKINEELDAFAHTVSHDLRAPLRNQMIAAEMFRNDFHHLMPKEGSELCNVISSSAKKMSALIEDLLHFSKLGRQPLNISMTNMKQLVEATVRELRDENGSALLSITVDEKLPDVYCDASMIKQVWVNFISNAIKYSSKKEKPLVDISSNVTGEEVVFSVKDNGAGFDMKNYDKLFAPFSRLHGAKEFSGTGIGLSIVKRIIEKHRGRVWAEGMPNEGAVFYFSLPLN